MASSWIAYNSFAIITFVCQDVGYQGQLIWTVNKSFQIIKHDTFSELRVQDVSQVYPNKQIHSNVFVRYAEVQLLLLAGCYIVS